MPYKDPERRRAYGRAWMKRNLDKAREAMRRWRELNREADRAGRRALYARNREAMLAREIAYRRAHPEVAIAKRHRRRAREVAAGGSFTASEWRELLRLHWHRCAYCGSEGPLHADHRVPLARGGTNFISNILPTCATCNQRKFLSTEEEFRSRLRRERRIEEAPFEHWASLLDPIRPTAGEKARGFP